MATHNRAARRATWVRKYRECGTTITAISREAGISRSTFYRWLRRYDPKNPQKSLRHLTRPRPRRRTKATPRAFIALSELNYRHPDWGKKRIYEKLQGAVSQIVADTLSDRKRDYTNRKLYAYITELIKVNPSEATIGRMLSVIRQRCPVCGERDGKHQMAHHDYGGVRDKLADVEVSVATRTVTHNRKKRRNPQTRFSLLLEAGESF